MSAHTGDETESVGLSGIDQVRARSAELFTVLRDDDRSDAARSTARDDLVHLHLSLVEHCARRFRN
ncbi:MAG: sigF 2, partial [Nocardioides sp.]|nr:sigF 2 [Nocardioides sp.]